MNIFKKKKKEELPIGNLAIVLGELCRIQSETNKILRQLAQESKQSLSTLTSFLAHEDTRRMRKEVKEAEDALATTPTKYDSIY